MPRADAVTRDGMVSVNDMGSVTSVERALRLMEALLDGPMGATGLASALGVSKATAFRLARTLEANGYVVQLEDTRYTLGPRCLMLGAWAFGHIDIRRELRWAEEELHEKTGETVLLSVQAGDESVCIDSIPSTRSIVSVASVGEVWPAHSCSAGLAMLAEDDKFRELYLSRKLEKATKHTVVDQQKLNKMLAEFRALGYSVNHSYWREGVSAVGAVVHDATGKPVAALSVMLPSFRLEQEGDVESLGELVSHVAVRASQRLGYRGRPPSAATF